MHLLEEEVVELITVREQDLIEAEHMGNAAAVLGVLAVDFRGEDEHGLAFNRVGFVREFAHARQYGEVVRIEQLSVRTFEQVVVAAAVVERSGSAAGQPRAWRYRVVDIWIHQVMHWELIARYRLRAD